MSTKKHNLFIKKIIERMKVVLGVKKTKELALDLEVSAQTISNWPKRKSIPLWHLCGFSQKHHVSIDYLLTGQESKQADSGKADMYHDKYLEYREQWQDARDEIYKLEQFIEKHRMKNGKRSCDKEAAQMLAVKKNPS